MFQNIRRQVEAMSHRELEIFVLNQAIYSQSFSQAISNYSQQIAEGNVQNEAQVSEIST